MAIDRVPNRYAVRANFRLPGGHAAAQTVGEELEVIANEHGGAISAADVVARASQPGTPLYEWNSRVGYFERNDVVAAQKHREEQARLLIRSVVITVESGDESLSTRGFYAVQSDTNVMEYRPISSIVASEEASKKVREYFQNELIRLDQQYRAYLAYMDFAQRFQPVFDAVELVIEEAAAEGNPVAKQARWRRRAGHIQLTSDEKVSTGS